MKLQLSSTTIWLAEKPVDFRQSIDGLCNLIYGQFNQINRDTIFVFHNKSRDKLKVLAWHGNGFVLLYKRLEQGKFTTTCDANGYAILDEKQFSWLLAGLDWATMSQWNTLEYDDFC